MIQTKRNFVFDFDSTLTRVEALDVLAEITLVNNPRKEEIINEIIEITNLGIDGKISFTESLERRIKLLNAKKSGGYDATKECYLIQKAKRTPEIEKYFQSKKYTNKNPDLYLYDAVNAKLDRIIEMLGAESVQERARLIKEAQKRAEEACQDSAIFPCSADGVSQREDAGKNCYFLDSGCGFQCIDDTLTAP